MVHLLWYGRLPSARELKDLTADRASRRSLPPATLALMREAARNAVPPMDALRMAAGTLSLGKSESPDEEARTLVASFATIVGAYQRLSSGQEPREPRSDLPHGEYCLHQMFGGEVGKERTRGLETYLNTASRASSSRREETRAPPGYQC
jgi:citrate synthase